MNPTSLITAILLGLLTIGAAGAATEPTELVNAQHCMACHMIDKPFLAPSFEQIANRYRHDPLAMPMLVDKLRNGGPPHWGDMPMPASVDRGGPLTDAQARVLVHWVLDR
jgi:cytochrome c551/c552